MNSYAQIKIIQFHYFKDNKYMNFHASEHFSNSIRKKLEDFVYILTIYVFIYFKNLKFISTYFCKRKKKGKRSIYKENKCSKI